MSKLEYTGERFVPEYKTNSIMALEHYHRYMFVMPYCQNKNVLDIACGAGYGSELMSRRAEKVLGADIDPKAIEYCSFHYTKDNLKFEVKSVDKIDYPQKTFDIITCFETIEHISEQQQKDAVALFGNVLKDDGILFISTPSLASPLHIKDNKYHIHELSQNEFYNLLSLHFKYVNIIGQSVCLCSIIGGSPNKSGCDCRVEISQDYKIGDCKYLMAICSNKEIPDINASSVYVDTSMATLIKLTKLRNKIGGLIKLYNFGIAILAKICPNKKWKQKIEKLKW